MSAWALLFVAGSVGLPWVAAMASLYGLIFESEVEQ